MSPQTPPPLSGKPKRVCQYEGNIAKGAGTFILLCTRFQLAMWGLGCTLAQTQIFGIPNPLLYTAPPRQFRHPPKCFMSAPSTPKRDWRPRICSLCWELHRHESPFPNLHAGGCELAFWRLKSSWRRFLEKRGPPDRGGTLGFPTDGHCWRSIEGCKFWGFPKGRSSKGGRSQ